MVLDEGKTIGAVARELDLTASALARWVKHARAERTQGKSGLVKEEREELLRLRREVRELRMEAHPRFEPVLLHQGSSGRGCGAKGESEDA